MTYALRRTATATLRSPARLEKAMRRRDVNGRELARLANVNREIISRLRRGAARTTSRRSAEAIEEALRARAGELFAYGEEEDVA